MDLASRLYFSLLLRLFFSFFLVGWLDFEGGLSSLASIAAYSDFISTLLHTHVPIGLAREREGKEREGGRVDASSSRREGVA